MTCSSEPDNVADMLDALDDQQAAAAFRRLVRHLRHRHDAQNIDLMGLAGFCRNCLADWIRSPPCPCARGVWCATAATCPPASRRCSPG